MAQPQIVLKLDHLIKTTENWTEVEVIYLLVQIRKLLDHARNSGDTKYKHLRFYCDWVVHINKDHIDESTLDVLKGFEVGMKKMIGNRDYHAPGPINFAYFENMQAELVEFLPAQGIGFEALTEDKSWINVISSLVKVLENQPLTIKASYGLAIKSLEFQLSAPRTVWLRAVFNEPIKGLDGVSYGYFDLKNAY